MDQILTEISKMIDRNNKFIQKKIRFNLFLRQHKKRKEDQEFHPGSEFYTFNGKHGTVKSLKDDEFEKSKRKTDKTHYCYSVVFDDGTSDTYFCQSSMYTPKDYQFALFEYDKQYNS